MEAASSSLPSCTDLENCTQEELIQLWREKWTGSQTQFCKRYHIHGGSFSQFVNRKFPSTVNENAIRLFLSHSEANPLAIISRPTSELKLPPLEGLKAVVFVDGDQACRVVDRLAWLGFADDTPIQIYIVSSLAGKDLVSERIRNLLDKYTQLPRWISAFHASSSGNNAADLAIAQNVGYFCNKIPLDVPFLLSSNDLFLVPILSELHSQGRTGSIIIDHKTSDLGIALLKLVPSLAAFSNSNAAAIANILQLLPGETPSFDSIFDKAHQITTLSKSVAPHISPDMVLQMYISELAPCVNALELYDFDKHDTLKRLKQDINTKCVHGQSIPLFELTANNPISQQTRDYFHVNAWEQLIHFPDIQTYLGVHLENRGHSIYFSLTTNVDSHPVSSNTHSEEPLREAYREYWKSTIDLFCERFKVNTGNFKAWLDRRRLSDLASSAAVLRFVSIVTEPASSDDEEEKVKHASRINRKLYGSHCIDI